VIYKYFGILLDLYKQYLMYECHYAKICIITIAYCTSISMSFLDQFAVGRACNNFIISPNVCNLSKLNENLSISDDTTKLCSL
jgi:hypothetical protein